MSGFHSVLARPANVLPGPGQRTAATPSPARSPREGTLRPSPVVPATVGFRFSHGSGSGLARTPAGKGRLPRPLPAVPSSPSFPQRPGGSCAAEPTRGGPALPGRRGRGLTGLARSRAGQSSVPPQAAPAAEQTPRPAGRGSARPQPRLRAAQQSPARPRGPYRSAALLSARVRPPSRRACPVPTLAFLRPFPRERRGRAGGRKREGGGKRKSVEVRSAWRAVAPAPRPRHGRPGLPGAARLRPRGLLIDCQNKRPATSP